MPDFLNAFQFLLGSPRGSSWELQSPQFSILNNCVMRHVWGDSVVRMVWCSVDICPGAVSQNSWPCWCWDPPTFLCIPPPTKGPLSGYGTGVIPLSLSFIHGGDCAFVSWCGRGVPKNPTPPSASPSPSLVVHCSHMQTLYTSTHK